MNPVVERVSGSLHMQLLSGCPPTIYWAGSYIWDLATHLTVCLASLVIFAIFDDKVRCPSLLESFRRGSSALAVRLVRQWGDRTRTSHSEH